MPVVSLIAWLIVLQFLLVAGFFVSLVWLLVGIIVGFKPDRFAANSGAVRPLTAVNSAAEPTNSWRIADSTPETLAG